MSFHGFVCSLKREYVKVDHVLDRGAVPDRVETALGPCSTCNMMSTSCHVSMQ